MFKNGLVSTVKVNGKFLRDDDFEIKIPFNTTYSLWFKNAENRTCVINVEIDGKNVTDNKWLVINAGKTFELIGFLEDNHINNKFKFIQLTKEIEDYKGINSKYSLIKITHKFVNNYWGNNNMIYSNSPITWNFNDYYNISNNIWIPCSHTIFTRNDWKQTGWGGELYCFSETSSYAGESLPITGCFLNGNTNPCDKNNLGITVKGEETSQDFSSCYIGDLEDKTYVAFFRLIGISDKGYIKNIVSFRDKLVCSTCGKKNNYKNKYCFNCGTFLEK